MTSETATRAEGDEVRQPGGEVQYRRRPGLDDQGEGQAGCVRPDRPPDAPQTSRVRRPPGSRRA
jgi:hypothetical protein